MKQKTLVVILTGALLAIGLIGFAVGASGGAFGHGGSLSCDDARAHHHHLMELIDELELNDSQRQHLDGIHHRLMARWNDRDRIHTETLAWTLERLEHGGLQGAETQMLIDQHLEELRTLAHGVSDELIALVDSLDEDQRAVLIAHLQDAQALIGYRGATPISH